MAWLGVLLTVSDMKKMLAKFKFGDLVMIRQFRLSPNLIDIW